MYIVQAFASLGSSICEAAKAWYQDCRSNRGSPGNEQRPLLHGQFSFSQHSLTSEYQDFSKTWRALGISLLHIFTYYTLAVIGFSFVLEKWPVIDSLYFATVVFTTIGYGDLKPTSTYSEGFTICLALYGIVLLGLFLGMAGEKIIDGQTEAMEKSRRKLQRMVMQSVAQKGHKPPSQARGPHLSSSMLEYVKDPTLGEEILNVVMLEAPIVAFVVALVMIAGYFEGWTMFDSVYYAVITGTTIGFGDFSPQIPGVRLACVFLLPLSVAVLGEFLTRVASVYIGRQTRKTEREFLNKTMTIADLETMDVDGDGKVQKGEFLAFMLVTLQKLDKEDIDDLLNLFNHLDVSQTGEVSREDVLAGSPNRSPPQSVC